MSGADQMPKGGASGRVANAHVEPDRATLHKDDRLMAIFSSRRSRQAGNIFGFDLPHDLLEAERRNMVAFINDDVAVLSDEVLHFTFAVETLKQSDVDETRPCRFAPGDLAYRLHWNIQKHRQSFTPLIQQLLAVKQNERTDFALCNQF